MSGPSRASREADGRLWDRRDFLEVCLAAAAAVGLPSAAAAEFLQRVQAGAKPSVIWLSFQECTGCTESLLRTTHPGLAELILDLVSLDYHETLMAAAGEHAEAARHAAMEANAGSYILVAEGAVPTRDGGIYCMIGGRTALEILEEAAEGAGAIVAIGSCASWGGIPSAEPNPTGASAISDILQDKSVVTIPGCPPNPYNFLGVVLQYATYQTLPALDGLGRPSFAYGRTIHEHCPRRPHFDAGRFAEAYGDEGHRSGWCLYELGCKGPQTFANCSTENFSEIPGAWPVGIGHPCFGCTERGIGFTLPVHETVAVPDPSPRGYSPVATGGGGHVSAWATGLAGLAGGALLGTGWMASRRMGEKEAAEAAATEEE
jgi:hydrogenase small subunit